MKPSFHFIKKLIMIILLIVYLTLMFVLRLRKILQLFYCNGWPTIFILNIQLTMLDPTSSIYKTEYFLYIVCIFCMQIYSFTPILMKFCTLDLQNKKKITVYFNFTKTNPYYHFQPC
jgi:hypothetical protein